MATTPDLDLDRLADDGCPHAPGPDRRPARRARWAAAAVAAAALTQAGCETLRNDHPSRFTPPMVSLSPGGKSG